MNNFQTELRASIPGSDPEICITLRSTGAVHISTNVQVDRDNLEVSTPEDWDSLVELVRVLREAQQAALARTREPLNTKVCPVCGVRSIRDATRCQDCGAVLA